MLHPATLSHRVEAIRHETGWPGGVSRTELPAPWRIAQKAAGAGMFLACARSDLASIYQPTRGRHVDSMVWWQQAKRHHRYAAHRSIRAAARILAECEAELRVPVLQAAE